LFESRTGIELDSTQGTSKLADVATTRRPPALNQAVDRMEDEPTATE